MSEGGAYFEEAAANLTRRIAEAEMRLTAAADVLAAVIKTDLDPTEAQCRFNEVMDALQELRRQFANLLSAQSA